MYQISDQQIDYILSDISARGVEMESLQQNLLDHVCCIIENNLEVNGDFENFYKKTIATFYKDELWEIEEETLLILTYKNYYTMKKIMMYSGIFSTFGLIAGSILKIMHWPGASALFILSGIGISFIFLPLLFILKSKEVSTKTNKFLIALAATFGILFTLSSIFKVMHWPGAGMMWYFALGILILLFIPIYFFTGIRNPETKVNTIITTIIITTFAGMLFMLTNLRPSARELNHTEVSNFIRDENMIALQKDSILKVLVNDSNYTELKNNANEIFKICDNIKSELLMYQIGYNKFTDAMKNETISFPVSNFSSYANKELIVYDDLKRINALKIEIDFYCDLVKAKKTKQLPNDKKLFLTFPSTMEGMHDKESYYYDNTVLGAYKDLQEIQINIINNLIELAEIQML